MARIALLTAALALAVTACGGGSEDISEADLQVDITADDFSFTPAVVEFPADRTVGFTMTNDGELEHYWVILEAPISSEAEIEDAEIIFEMEAHGGDTVSKLFEPDLEPGVYQVICTEEGHFDAGMIGEVRVTS